jgi:hypothetical protein
MNERQRLAFLPHESFDTSLSYHQSVIVLSHALRTTPHASSHDLRTAKNNLFIRKGEDKILWYRNVLPQR